MSYFDHLVERAFGHARVVEPLIGPAMVGPAALTPDPGTNWTAQLEEVTAPPPPPSRSLAPTPRASTTTIPTSRPTPPVAPLRVEHTREVVAEVQVPAAQSSPIVRAPVAAPPRQRGEQGERSPIVERHVEVRSERTRELVAATHVERHTSTTREQVETRITTQVEVRPAEIRQPAARGTDTTPPPRRTAPSPSAAPSSRGAEPIVPLAAPPAPARARPRAERPASVDAPLSRRAAPPEAPTLRIEIGRVIVRADVGSAPQRSTAAPTRPMTSLAEYLHDRERGKP